MFVEILVGAYGYRPKGSTYVTPVYRGGVCEVDTAEGEYLIRTGAAIEVDGHTAVTEEPLSEALTENAEGNLSAEEKTVSEAPVDSGEDDTVERVYDGEYLSSLSMSELKRIAEEKGLEKIGQYRSKASLASAILAMDSDEYQSDEMPPDISASEVIG